MKISIRWALILGFLVLILGTQILIISSSYLSSQKTLLRHARDVMQNIADLTMEQSENHLALAQGAAHLTKRLISSNVVSSEKEHQRLLEKYFLDQLTIYPHFAGIYLGAPNGDFFYVSRLDTHSPGGFRTKIISNSEGGRFTRLIWRDKDHRLLSEESDPQDTYDPRKRPWYKKALAQQAVVWTDPYIFFTTQKPGITIAGPVLGSSGRLRGIVGVDLEIDQLSSFIGKLRIGQHGRAFMINDKGDVVAFPDLTKIKFGDDQNNSDIRLVKIEELDDGLSRAAYQAISWGKTPEGRLHLDRARFARFEYQGQVYDTMFTPFKNEKWPWIIGVYIPENDYLGSLKDNRRLNIIITIGFSVLATLIGLWLARGIIRPLAGLEKEALAIKRHELNQQFDTHSSYKEIYETADAFARMKLSLRTSEERYRQIFENIQDVYYETSLGGEILEISPSVQKVSGYARGELIGVSMNRLYTDQNDRDRFIATITETKTVQDYELTLLNKNGAVEYCSICATLKQDETGRPEKVIGSLRVITDRKNAEIELLQYKNQLQERVEERTRDLEKSNLQLRNEIETRKAKEEELRRSEDKYRSIIENMDNGYYEIDLEGYCTFFNEPLRKMLGYTPEEMYKLNYRDVLTPETADEVRGKFEAIRRTGVSEKLSRYTVIRKDGSTRILEGSAALIADQKGHARGFSGVILDVTEKSKAEQEKKKLKQHYQQIERLEGIATLAGGVAHDFNNLLMGIQGNVSLMLLETGKDNHFYEKLKSIESCVSGGAELTRQLLGFARGGKYMVRPVDLNQITMDTARMFGRTRKEIRIIEKFMEGLWTASGDRNQLEQVLLNLYINAWQAMPQGGNIYVETQNIRLDGKNAEKPGIPAGPYVCISVTDTGAGMEESIQKRIFEPFFTTKEIGIGTGLGLASAYGIIKNHGGAIDLVSRVGEGTTFYIYLPATDEKVTPSFAKTEKPRKGSGTILLVDDETVILQVTKPLLEELGYTVWTAQNGKNALSLYEEHAGQIDLVILDMVMPEMGGGAVFDGLKAIDPGVKVLLYSGFSRDRQAEDIMSRGCAGFIQKPFKLEMLSKSISEILRRP